MVEGHATHLMVARRKWGEGRRRRKRERKGLGTKYISYTFHRYSPTVTHFLARPHLLIAHSV
jgi:hypothetical protein